MDDKLKGPRTAGRTELAAVGIGVLAVVCCAGLPLIAGVLGGIALGSVLGVGAGVLTAVVAIALVVARARRGKERVLPMNTGAEAIETGIQTARTAPNVTPRRGGEA